DRQPRTAFTATSDADRAFAADRRLDRQLTPSTQATTILTPTDGVGALGHFVVTFGQRLPEAV
ncbi:MAG: hypothetical protein AB1486_18180, partial [Planctomycetota bacterium]